MKKFHSKMIALLLACMVLSTVLVPASATEVSRASKTGELFTLYVTKVTDMITTMNSPGKYFISYELPSTATIYMSGVLKHTVAGGYNIRSGAFYLHEEGTRSYCLYDLSGNGDQITDSVAVSSLASGYTYRGLVENCNSSGYVYDGSVIFSCY